MKRKKSKKTKSLGTMKTYVATYKKFLKSVESELKKRNLTGVIGAGEVELSRLNKFKYKDIVFSVEDVKTLNDETIRRLAPALMAKFVEVKDEYLISKTIAKIKKKGNTRFTSTSDKDLVGAGFDRASAVAVLDKVDSITDETVEKVTQMFREGSMVFVDGKRVCIYDEFYHKYKFNKMNYWTVRMYIAMSGIDKAIK